MLTEKFFSGLGDVCISKNIRKNRGYVSGSMTFDFKHYGAVQKKLNSIADEVAKNGEKISCEISSGGIVDSGAKQFDVLKGAAIEVYDYEKMSVTFIRLYCIGEASAQVSRSCCRNTGGKRKWVALYIDENPSTPWWSKEERKG